MDLTAKVLLCHGKLSQVAKTGDTDLIYGSYWLIPINEEQGVGSKAQSNLISHGLLYAAGFLNYLAVPSAPRICNFLFCYIVVRTFYLCFHCLFFFPTASYTYLPHGLHSQLLNSPLLSQPLAFVTHGFNFLMASCLLLPKISVYGHHLTGPSAPVSLLCDPFSMTHFKLFTRLD